MLIKFSLDDELWELFEQHTNDPAQTIRELIEKYTSNGIDPLDQIVSADEAAKLWGLAPSYVKDLCAKELVRAVKIGKTWVIDINQPNPKKK